MRIEEAIQQKSFKDPQHKAQINILYTAAWLNQHNNLVLKPHRISLQQFNILRILRGMKGEPATIKLLTSRMLDKMSNASRLVDKLVSKKLVQREQAKSDRRRVDITITKAGMKMVEAASTEMEQSFQANFNSLNAQEAETLSELLDKIRG
jgi:DNA-binding MarR family transcriptional regulator